MTHSGMNRSVPIKTALPSSHGQLTSSLLGPSRWARLFKRMEERVQYWESSHDDIELYFILR